MRRFIFTCGDVNGIGPEITIKALNKVTRSSNDRFIFVCPSNIFYKTAEIIKPNFRFLETNNLNGINNSKVILFNTGSIKMKFGAVTKESGEAAFRSIETALKICKWNSNDAIITAPISKTAIQLAGYHFPGHTEIFAGHYGVKNYVMMFLSKKMNAALATIHEPIKKVPGLISQVKLSKKLDVIIQSLKMDLRIAAPRVAVLGLNPHAGENGIIGNEEEKIISPLIKNRKYSDYLSGPYSPDAFFANKLFNKFDLVFGMYHDQVLIPFKFMNFGAGVNFTAGLPIVRTSPDHGTAFDIAGKGIADESSIISAYNYAKIILCNRNRR